MLFYRTRSSAAFQRALHSAVKTHRPAALRALLASHGEQAFGGALSEFSGRVIADALSVLPATDRARVLAHLPRSARRRLFEFDKTHELVSACTRLDVNDSSLILFK